MSCRERGGKVIWWKKIKTIQQLDRYDTVLLLATWKQVKSTLLCCCQSTRPVVDLLPPPSSSSIPWTRLLSSANASVIVFVVFMLIFLLRRLRCRRRFFGPVVYPPPPPPLSLITRTCCVSLVLFRRLCRRRWVLWPVLICQHRCCRFQYPLPVNTPLPLQSDNFTQTRCILCFLKWRLHCRRWDLGLIFLFRRLHRGRLFLRPVITTQKPPSSSPNIWFLGHILYSLSSVNASAGVVEYVVQAVKDYPPLGSWLRISSGDGLYLWLLGAVVCLTLLETAPLKTVEVQTEYLDFFTRNIQSFGWVWYLWLATLTRQGINIWS